MNIRPLQVLALAGLTTFAMTSLASAAPRASLPPSAAAPSFAAPSQVPIASDPMVFGLKCAQNVLDLLSPVERIIVVDALITGHPPTTTTVAVQHAYVALRNLLALFSTNDQRRIINRLAAGVSPIN